MYLPTAMIQSAAAQRRHFDTARLDTAPEGAQVPTQHGAGYHGVLRVRRTLADLLLRAGRAVAPSAPGAGRPAAV